MKTGMRTRSRHRLTSPKQRSSTPWSFECATRESGGSTRRSERPHPKTFDKSPSAFAIIYFSTAFKSISFQWVKRRSIWDGRNLITCWSTCGPCVQSAQWSLIRMSRDGPVLDQRHKGSCQNSRAWGWLAWPEPSTFDDRNENVIGI